jgi:hypothetical protein
MNEFLDTMLILTAPIWSILLFLFGISIFYVIIVIAVLATCMIIIIIIMVIAMLLVMICIPFYCVFLIIDKCVNRKNGYNEYEYV